MKICFLTDDPAEIGGGPEHIRRVSRILRQKYDCAVDVITPLTMDPKFNFSNFWHRVKFTFWVLKFLLISNYDIYHSHTFSTAAFLPLVKIRGKKAGITVHGSGEKIVSAGILNKTFIPKFWRWLVLSVWSFDFRLSAGKLKNFIVVGNGVDIDEFSKTKRGPHKIFTILCIARHDPAKGVKILEDAIKNLKNVKLNLISGRQRALSDFTNADLYVLPSLSEGLPIVLLEAMAAKLPVVATDVGDCRELVEKSNCGIIVKPNSVEELIKAIMQMINNKNRTKMGKRGFQYVKENYTWEKVAAYYYSAYRRINPLI